LLCSALENYGSDLQKARRSTIEKLYNTKPEFRNLDTEEGLIERALNDLCKK
jgi:hypothetical protein